MKQHEIMKRKGFFKLDKQIIEKEPEIVMQLLGKMIIVRAEMMYITNTIEYGAYSELFEEVEEGKFIPTYDIKIHKIPNNDDGIDISFEAIKTIL